MIIDCFTFFNEFDLLRIRWEELRNSVDSFMLSESTMTFSAKSKPLHFRDSGIQYPHLTGIAIDDMPTTGNAWSRESLQRIKIMDYLADYSDDDIVMISDVDEIPHHEIVDDLEDILTEFERVRFVHPTFYYYLNGRRCDAKCGSAAKLGTLRKNGLNLQNLRTGSGEYKCKTETIRTGWHFSYLGGVESIQEKLRSFSHTEYNKPKFLNEDHLRTKIADGKDILNRSKPISYVSIDDTWPQYVFENQDEYEHLIMPLDNGEE